jgi:hypothetical protein
MSEKVKSIFLDNTTVHSDQIVDHDLTKPWQTIFGADNPNINNDSLVAYWRFFDDNAVATVITDSSGNSHDITLSSGLSLSDDTPYKNKNTTVSFNGTSDYGTVADSTDLSFGDESEDSPFSISFWAKPSIDDPSVSYYNIINKKASSGTAVEYAVWLEDPENDNFYTVHFQLYDNPSSDNKYKYVIDDYAITENKWYNIVITYNGDETDSGEGVSIYINGEKKTDSMTVSAESAPPYTAMHETSADINIGRWGTTSYYSGELSELAIWNRELTAAEAKALYAVKYGAMSNSFASYSPRLMLRDADNHRGQYPTVRRTGDKDRSGSFNIQFNDENTVEYKKIPTVYPGEKDQSFSITDNGTSYTYSSQASLVAHWRPQDAVIPTSEGFPILDALGRTRFLGGGRPVQGQAYIVNRVPGGQIANVENFATIQEADDPRHNSFTERDGKLYEDRGTRNSYKYLYNGAVDYDGLNIGTAATWDAIIGPTTSGGTAKMTFSMWVNPTDWGPSDEYGRLLQFGNQDVRLYFDSTGQIRISVKATDVTADWDSTASIGKDEWTHISVSYDATNATNDPDIYINGE